MTHGGKHRFKSSNLQGFKIFALLLITVVELLNPLNLDPAAAQTPPFYQGKTITWIVGSKAGDAYDLYPRLLAECNGEFLLSPAFT